MMEVMADKEIVKALECCAKDDCDNCPCDFGNCYSNLAGYALCLINHLKREIEGLGVQLDSANALIDFLEEQVGDTNG